ncbi:MAG: SEC-C domain-containing protein [Acidobacteria bacterium]|nr:SEC-C domain-containing protein [Acidobacteriota bacterium]
MNQKMPGRNDPCHCGSGKKYKKCCLAKDDELRKALTAELETAEEDWESSLEDDDRDFEADAEDWEIFEEDDDPDWEPDPQTEAFNELLEEFEAADYEDKFKIFNRTLDDPELMDGDMAYEMLQNLFDETVEHGERNRFNTLVENLRTRLPETYAAEEPFLVKWRIENALADARYGDVPDLLREQALLAGRDIDLFNRTEEMSAYHGRLQALVDSMRIAWPHVESSDNIAPWGVDEFCFRAVSYEILNFVERTHEAAEPDAGLLERLAFYSEIDEKEIAANLAHLTGRIVRQWTMNDFELPPPRTGMDEEDEENAIDESAVRPHGERNLYHLTLEFLGYLHGVEGVSYAKGELGRRELHRFLVERHDGGLEYRESMLESFERDMGRKKKRQRRKPRRKYRRYEHMLVPDPERLEHYLAGLLNMISGCYHRTAAFFELIRGWLRFLETKGLIDAGTRTQAIDSLAHLADRLCSIFDTYRDDPAPGRALHLWRDKAGV